MKTSNPPIIQLRGKHFNPYQHRLDCWFGFRVSTPALYSSSTLVKCAVPKLLPGTVAVYLGDEQGIHGNSNGQYTVVSRGHVHAVEPSSGPVTGGTAVVMSVRGGAGFASAIFCRIGEGQVVQAQALSSSRILCTMPAVQKSGTVLIRAVEGAQGSSRGLEGEVRYVYYNEPVVTRVEPSSGALEGGTMLSLYGRGLEEGSNLTCRFGTGDAVAGRQETSTMATCVAPPRPVKDVVWLQVSLNGGADFSGSAVEYAYEAGATVDEVRPSAGDSGVDGQTVTVIGRHFGSGQGLSCLFGTRGRVRGMPMTSTAVVCVAPRGGPGAVGVSVSNNGVDEGQTRGGFVYSGDLKVIRKVTPSSGPLAGGTNVTIAVDGLRRAALSWTTERPLWCLFRGISENRNAVRGRALTTSLISCKSPTSLRAGETKIEIELSNHGPTLSIESAFVYYEGPEVSSVVPSIGRQTGGMVVSVVGQGLISRDPVCQFGPSIVQGKDVTSLSSSLLLCTTPASLLGSTVVRLQVSLNGGADFSGSAVEYAYEAGATVDEVRPSAGDSGVDGQTVTVIGRHFGSGQGLSCLFGTRGRVRGMPMTSTAVVCVAPRGGPGAVGVSVSNNGVDEGQTRGGFVYSGDLKVIRKVTPSSGPLAGGTNVTIAVDGLRRAALSWTTERPWGCVFGTSVVQAQALTTSLISCKSPTSLRAGETKMSLVDDLGNVVVKGKSAFVYYEGPEVSSVVPSIGRQTGGMVVSVVGQGLISRDPVCQFGPSIVQGKDVTSLSSSLLLCTTPASLLGSTVVRLQVSLNGGADFSGSAVEYAYEAGATVDEVRPSAGDSGVDGQTVTVIGRHFGSGQGLSCLFGTRGRVRGMPMTSTAVVCVAPRGGPGAVGVSVSNNGVEGETASGIVSVRYEYRSGMSAKSVGRSEVRTGLGSGSVYSETL
ncbi:hypothetical protein GUITHDRAFT_112036 [Guillardia theta CCMP2712]|uniref:IPT/TIG domain-containing protein n=1 Tax=Guillardia theta (strain CCMP2712) TaxID=905079 RepID=L1J084_GUITC|nr:hypothetical protein GUITHDRAFT_112036 [Guillardia theta CCMP2712]EKX41896.1 hypothetical protein GUITHDRAFT_112036 [Guillardia theta CCMP2712]|eukprot:XP_005828876.1 hypothetical protein GUITHDRAFT_112036 [Guillardia theta CCMP2712]